MPRFRHCLCLAFLLTVAVAPSSEAATGDPPPGRIRFLYQSRPETGRISDAWRKAETALVAAAASRGDYASMSQAHAYVIQQARGPIVVALSNARQAIEMRDAAGAAGYLANANAFFPVGRMGRFGYDASGNVWCQELNAADPSRPVGSPFEVNSGMVGNLISMERAGSVN